MRIKNKLVTVQLVMTFTLFLSIVIFAGYVVSFISISDAEMEISKLDSIIDTFEIVLDSTVNKRVPAEEMARDLESLFQYQEEVIEILQETSILRTRTLRTFMSELDSSFSRMKGTTFRRLNQAFEDSTENPDADQLFNQMGVTDAILYLRDELEKTNNTDRILFRDLSIANEIYAEQHNLKAEYELFTEIWDDVHLLMLERLEDVRSNSIFSTIVMLAAAILIAFIVSYRITNNITISLNSINKTLSDMSNGDFHIKLHIPSGDEFGDLSRKFNQFIEDLWTKLDAMNIIMGDIGKAMNEDLDVQKIQSDILRNVISHIRTDSSGILLLRNGELHLTSAKGHFPPFFPIEEDLSTDRPRAARYLFENPVPLDTPIIQRCIESRKPVLVKDCTQDPDFPQCNDIDSALFISSIMLVPLINAGNVLGIFVVIRSANKKPFSDLDFSNFASFSDYAALTIDTLDKYSELIEKFEMQKEIGVAADIQKSLIPAKMPQVKGLTSSAYTVAAKGVSGDYYDFFRMNKSTIGATICDVAGKGVPASLVMVMIRTILRLVSSPKRGAAETLTMLNRSISGKIDIDRYATMSFFKIDLETMKLNYSNAAHHPIQIYRQENKKFYAIDSPGLPIGIDRDAKFAEKRVSLRPGDIIFMYTDGFPEARNHDGDEYSTNRMLREIRLHCNSSAKQILDSVVEDMQKFTGRASQHDDQTILIIKIDEDK